MSKHFYITTTLPYVNAEPHIGFAMEIIRADVLARYHRLCGDEVIFNTGTDEHGLKIYRKALAEGKDPQIYCDEYAAKFQALKEALNLTYTNFIRTTDAPHKAAAQAFWLKCLESGDIYKKNYRVKYCVGCEMEKTDSELADGRCAIHPKLEIELLDEENYFFRWSKYQPMLLALYEKQPDFVVPVHRLTEIRAFVARGLEDFSISRLKLKMPWGVAVPNDTAHVMYVWFDALVNYISTLGWPQDEKQFKQYWPGAQIAGKDNLRQQSAMWQAMLMSAGLPPSQQIFIEGFITADGQKMSKSLGNVVNPYDIVERYGADALRHYLVGALPSYEDGDFSLARFESWYTAELANGIGNLTSRILTMLEKYSASKMPACAADPFHTPAFWQAYEQALNIYRFDSAVERIGQFVLACDELISKEKPWEKAKQGQDVSALLYQLGEGLRHLALALLPIIPAAAESILARLGIKLTDLSTLAAEKKWGQMPSGSIIQAGQALFPRLNG